MSVAQVPVATKSAPNTLADLQSLNLLISLLSAGAAISAPAFVPTPQHLALAATLVVHPLTTTRAKTTDKAQASNIALRLLRLTNDLVGPRGAEFEGAFRFTAHTSRHGGRRKSENVSSDDGSQPVNNPLAQESSLWERAEDFWHVVGWAFNCSMLYPKRWERWQLLLDLMCEVLEADWKQRSPEDDEEATQSQAEQERAIDLSEGSLLYAYVDRAAGGYSKKRRILRAIFADGSPKSTNEFREVFKNEPKELTKDEDKPKKERVELNIDEGSFGDYMDNEDDDEFSRGEEEAAPGPRRGPGRPRRKRKDEDGADGGTSIISASAIPQCTSLGDIASIALRQRFLGFLTSLSTTHPRVFATLDDTYRLLVEFIKPLPLPTFQLFIAPTIAPAFNLTDQQSLCEVMLQTMIESDAPSAPTTRFNQEKLMTYYLPYAAASSSVLDNAKFSLLLESLLRVLALDEEKPLELTSELSDAVQDGIEARVGKVQRSPVPGKKSRKKGEEVEWEWLLESGQRMLHISGAS